ncbi:MAG: hypothetical protein WDM80_15750 [Limisphaerales bacterium]
MKCTKETAQKPRHVMTHLLVFFALAAVTYILSIGPVLSVAARLDAYHSPFYKPLREFYSPVFALAKSSDTATHLYESYVRIWCRIVLPPGSPGT